MSVPGPAMAAALRRILGERAYNAYLLAEVRALVPHGLGRVRAVDEAECAKVQALMLSAPRAPEPEAHPASVPERNVEADAVRQEDDDDRRESRRGPRLSLVDRRF